MSVVWPSHLVDRLVDGQWVLFIGSGIAATCSNSRNDSPPTWSGLLERLCDLIRDDDARAVGERLIGNRELLPAADHIRHILDSENNLQGYFSAIRTAVDGPGADRYAPSPLYDTLLSLDPRIVFTTNYDRLFEAASRSGFATYRFDQAGLSNELRRGEPVLVKLHGSTDSPTDMVLTRTDYARVAISGREVFEILKALSLTSTILFVGYSLDDPDIQLVLQAVGRTGLSPEAHFLLAPEPESAARIPVFRESYGVSILPYPAPSRNHGAAAGALEELAGTVIAGRARRTTNLTA